MTININIGNPQGPAGPAGVAVAIPANTIVANNTNATANPAGITAAQARALLELANVASSGSASDLASGTVNIARLPTGISESTVTIGNDTRLAKYFQAASSDGNNLFLGANTGNTSMSPNGGAANLASHNTIVGSLSFQDNTTGEGNSGLGTYVLADNTTGYKNSGVGYAALTFNTTGHYNSALGKGALYNNTSGHSNTAIGVDSLFYCTTGDNNTAVGIDALYRLTSGYYNVGVGPNSLVQLTTGVQNVGIGYASLYNATNAQSNVAVGTNAGRTLTTGRRNVFIGEDAGNNVLQKVDVEDSVAIGFGAYTTRNGQVVIKGTIINVQAAEGLQVAGSDSNYLLGLSGATKGLRAITNSSGFSLEAVDNTLSASYEPLTLRGSSLNFVGPAVFNSTATVNGLLSGTVNTTAITKSALLALTASATAGEYRITDSTPAQRRAYPDGTNWRYSDDSTIVT